MIFPEEGRSPDGCLRPFKKGAFVMALEKKWPLRPVTMNGRRRVLAKRSLTMTPGTMEVTVGEPLETVPYDPRNVNALMERAINDIVAHYRSDG